MWALGVDGVRVGHWTDSDSQTGCTVIEYPQGTVASFEARGGAPASRELELLHPDKTVTAIDAVLLTGGSAFGLAAADGVMRYYEERRRGVQTPSGVVPIVPALALYDLGVGDGTIRPTPANGYSAAEATAGPQVVTGRIGAGAGAYVAHWRGPEGKRPAGLASHVVRHDRLVVSALCAVNAFGDVTDEAVDFDALRLLSKPFGGPRDHDDGRRHTTIGVISTNARIDKAACRIVAQGAHDGLARSITPPHSRFDGDAFIAAATGAVDADIDLIRYLALLAVTKAIQAFGTEPVPYGIDHIVLTVADVQRSIEFYERVLGMRPVTFGAGRRALQFGAHKINLHVAGQEIRPHAAVPTPGSADVCLVTHQPLEDVSARLLRAEVHVEEGPVARTGARGPITSLYIRDPDQNLIEIASYERTADDRGA